ncbi:alpha/beta fold hydrolase [Streptomyces sp. NPDC091272]|uniref:alpha/beta fold hydrolase n=1 Tax=Streptomyces sp. NPDC091272 TaxID=3365981 RepID=UPI0038060AAF
MILDAASGTPGLTWAPVLPGLAKHVRVIAYDRAGLGMSDPAIPFTAETSVEDLIALLTDAVPGPCVLVGSSWGGLLAQRVAWAVPELISGLVLVDPAHEEFQPLVGRLADEAFARVFAVQKTLGLAERFIRKGASRAAQVATRDQRVQELLVDAELACYAHKHQIRTAMAENRMVRNQIRTLRRLRASSQLPDVPVMVLSATEGLPKDMRARWTELQAQIASTAERGEHSEVPEAGHYIHQSQPEVVTRAVLDVVERAGLR